MPKYVNISNIHIPKGIFEGLNVPKLLYWLESLPAADVEEVRHGRWVLVKPRRTGRNATYKCTVCKRLYSSYYNDVQEWTHCPCGAKMDGKE